MYNAPPVNYSVGRSAVYGTVLALFWLFGALSISFLCYKINSDLGLGLTGVSGLHVMAWTTLPLTAGFALQSWRTQALGELRWTGLGWVWLSAPQQQIAGRVSVVLDWQRGLLLHFQPLSGRGWWCWLARTAQPSRWQDLRRAVYAPSAVTSNPAPDALHTAMPHQP